MATTSSALDSSPTRRWRPGVFFDRTFPFWALLPTLITMVALTIYPVFQLLRMSVSDLEFVKGKLVWTYVGLAHVDKLQNDVVLPTALRNTLLYVVVVVAVETVLGLSLAVLVSRVTRLAWLYRSIYIMPLLIPAIAIGTMWRLMYDYNYGIINKILLDLGLMSYKNLPLWTADPHRALSSVMIVDIWHWTSFLFLIMLAGVESLPHELAEAARVDGANERQVIRYVFLPLLRPTIIVALMLRTILAFKVFDQIFLLTGGGPGTATEVISLYIYKVYFVQSRLGYGALLALVTALIISVFVIFYQWLNTYLNRER
jgi:multiple sugar transport system permease protein